MAVNIYHGIVLYLISCVLLAACACDKNHRNINEINAKEDVSLSCKKVEDCALVNPYCCGCHEGGTQKAIAKSVLSEYLSTLANCGAIVCAQVMSNDESCKKSLSCKHGQCVLD
jgi:hypothetical protein